MFDLANFPLSRWLASPVPSQSLSRSTRGCALNRDLPPLTRGGTHCVGVYEGALARPDRCVAPHHRRARYVPAFAG